jgi:hypothetical protein
VRNYLVAGVLILFAMSLGAQLPVPIGGGSLSVEIVVTDTSGTPLPGATLSVVGPRGNLGTFAVPNNGVVRIPVPAAGTYTVSAQVSGFSSATQTVTIGPGSSSRLEFRLGGGPIPIGGVPVGGGGAGSNPASSTSSIDVIERNFTDDVAAQVWLAEQAAQKREILSVVPIGRGKSLFVFLRVSAAPQQPLVVSAGHALDASDLQSRARAHSDRKLRGVHLIGATSYLLVFE